MINSIKLLKSKNSPCDVCKYDGDKSCDASGGEFGECKPAEELFKALREALLALEQKEKAIEFIKLVKGEEKVVE